MHAAATMYLHVAARIICILYILNIVYDVVYCRFLLHAVSIEEEDEIIKYSYSLLNKDGSMFIECRSINDPMARKGEILSSSERISGHYRRFIDPDELLMKVKKIGFDVVDMTESSGLSICGDDDPVLIRIHLESRRLR